jgi:hypothetical protein
MTHPEREEAAEALAKAVDQLSGVRRTAGAGLGGLLGGFLLGRARRAVRAPLVRFRRLKRFGWGAAIVVLSVTTCSGGVDPAALTAQYGDPVPASREDAARVLTRGVDAFRRAPETGAVRFTLTESEATSALGMGLMMPELMRAAGRIPREELEQVGDLEALRARIWREADAQRAELAERSGLSERLLLKLDPRIRTGDLEVRFEGSGEVVVAGYVQAWSFRLPGIFVVAPRARDGTLDLDFVSGRLGRLPLPELAFDWVGSMLVRGILLGRDYAEVSEITVGDGTLTFAGRVTS